MIPKVCVNCGIGANVGNEQQVFGHVCNAMPFTLWVDNPLDHTCGGFKMSDVPIYVLPDDPQAPGADGQEIPVALEDDYGSAAGNGSEPDRAAAE